MKTSSGGGTRNGGGTSSDGYFGEPAHPSAAAERFWSDFTNRGRLAPVPRKSAKRSQPPPPLHPHDAHAPDESMMAAWGVGELDEDTADLTTAGHVLGGAEAVLLKHGLSCACVSHGTDGTHLVGGSALYDSLSAPLAPLAPGAPLAPLAPGAPLAPLAPAYVAPLDAPSIAASSVPSPIPGVAPALSVQHAPALAAAPDPAASLAQPPAPGATAPGAAPSRSDMVWDHSAPPSDAPGLPQTLPSVPGMFDPGTAGEVFCRGPHPSQHQPRPVQHEQHQPWPAQHEQRPSQPRPWPSRPQQPWPSQRPPPTSHYPPPGSHYQPASLPLAPHGMQHMRPLAAATAHTSHAERQGIARDPFALPLDGRPPPPQSAPNRVPPSGGPPNCGPSNSGSLGVGYPPISTPVSHHASGHPLPSQSIPPSVPPSAPQPMPLPSAYACSEQAGGSARPVPVAESGGGSLGGGPSATQFIPVNDRSVSEVPAPPQRPAEGSAIDFDGVPWNARTLHLAQLPMDKVTAPRAHGHAHAYATRPRHAYRHTYMRMRMCTCTALAVPAQPASVCRINTLAAQRGRRQHQLQPRAASRVLACPCPQLMPLLRSLQLTRDELRALSGEVSLMSSSSFFVRLNMSSSSVAKYVGVQVAAVAGEEVRVRGIEASPTEHGILRVQRTKLQYVSNRPFEESEILDIARRLVMGSFEAVSEDTARKSLEDKGRALH